MVVKAKEKFEKTRYVKNNDNSKKIHFTRTKKYKIPGKILTNK